MVEDIQLIFIPYFDTVAVCSGHIPYLTNAYRCFKFQADPMAIRAVAAKTGQDIAVKCSIQSLPGVPGCRTDNLALYLMPFSIIELQFIEPRIIGLVHVDYRSLQFGGIDFGDTGSIANDGDLVGNIEALDQFVIASRCQADGYAFRIVAGEQFAVQCGSNVSTIKITIGS